MIRRGWMDLSAADPVPAVTLPAADFDRLLALLEECAERVEEAVDEYWLFPRTEGLAKGLYDRDMDLPRRVRAMLKEVSDGEG
jgi:hypothetical protein